MLLVSTPLISQSSIPRTSNVLAQDDSFVPPTHLLHFPRHFPSWLYTILIVPRMIYTYIYYKVPMSRFCLESCQEIQEFSVPLQHSQYSYFCILLCILSICTWSFFMCIFCIPNPFIIESKTFLHFPGL